MKNKIQIALLAIIAGALVYLAVSRSGGTANAEQPTEASSLVASQSTTSPTTPAEVTKTFDPMAKADQQVVDNRPKTTVNFSSYEHDFGNIKQDTDNKYVFKFTNTGKEPLIIESATGSCGCTVPNYPKAPVAPGAEGVIEIAYKPGKQENAQQKTVTVVANTEPKQTILRIKANVQKDPNAPAVTPVTAPGH